MAQDKGNSMLYGGIVLILVLSEITYTAHFIEFPTYCGIGFTIITIGITVVIFLILSKHIGYEVNGIIAIAVQSIIAKRLKKLQK